MPFMQIGLIAANLSLWFVILQIVVLHVFLALIYSNLIIFMYAKKTPDRRIDLKSATEFKAALNADRSIYLAELKEGKTSTRRRIVIKSIPLFSEAVQLQAAQEAVIRKMCSSSLYYFKPEGYDFRDGNLFLCMKVQPISLQTLLWIHRKEVKTVSREAVRQFIIKMFDGLARLKASDLFPGNLKPTNLFMEQKEGETAWMWSEAGLQSVRRSQLYSKIPLQPSKNTNMKVDAHELEFYALAVMILEMITLQSPQDIDKVLRRRGDLSGINNFSDAEDYYGKRVTNIVALLLQPPKDSSLNRAIQEYKESPEDEEEQPDYAAYALTQERIDQFVKDEFITKTQNQVRRYIGDKSISAREVFDLMARLDPDFSFWISGMGDFDELLQFLGVRLQPHELVFFTLFYSSGLAVRYFKFLQSVFPARELIENIVCKAVENYDSFKDFFEAQTNGREFWKSEELKIFLQTLQAPFQEKQVSEVVKSWTGGARTSVKYDELFKIFKPLMGMSMSLSSFQKGKSVMLQGGEPLKGLLEQLMKKEPDLIAFFRKHDLKENWIVDFKIEKVLRSYLKTDEETIKKAFAEMWKKGSIEGDMSKQINYVYLIRNLGLYENLELLRLILTQKINQDGRQAFLEKYMRDQRGWNYLSFVDFNKDENLQFEQRELKSLFSQLDTDRSGILEPRQLLYKLTGLKQFDYEAVVESIRHAIDKQGVDLFQSFKTIDSRARLVLGSAQDLQQILQSIGIELSEDHLNALFNKFARTGKFEYLAFLRLFTPMERLFLTATKFVLREHYRNDFDKLFAMGVREGRKKWNRQSLALVSEEMVLGFREAELGEIWTMMDSNGEGSLTKEEVAEAFSYEVQKREQLTRKQVQSIKDLPRKKQEEEVPVASNKRVPTGNKEETNKEEAIIKEFEELGDKKFIGLAYQLFQESQDKNGQIQMETSIRVFDSCGIRPKKVDMVRFLTRFKELQNGRRTILNFIALLFFLADSFSREDESSRLKSAICLSLMRQIKKAKNLSNQQMFEWCRKRDRMRLSDFQEVFRKMVDVEVYFQDLEAVWHQWGEQEYFTLEDIDALLGTREYRQKQDKDNKDKDKEKGGKEQTDRTSKFKGMNRKGEDNKMSDFINESEGSDTPYLRNAISFADKDPELFKKESSNRNSIRDSGPDSRNQREATGRARRDSKDYNNNNKIEREKERQREKWERQRERQREKERQKEPTSRFGGEKKKSAFTNQKNSKEREEKIDLEEQYDLKKAKQSKREQQKPTKSALNKTQLLQKLKRQMEQGGEEYINELFAKANLIQSKRFISCLTIHYNFTENEATQLAEALATFGKIKLDSLRSNLAKTGKTDREEKGKTGKSKEKADKNDKNERLKSVERIDKTQSPKKQKVPEGKRLIDPRRQKLNVPLVREHIRLLVSSFTKRFELSEFEGYFFGEHDYVSREDFIAKCQSVDASFKGTICEKIFDYLKPDSQDRVGLLSFKLGTGLDEVEQEGEEDFLPEQLEKELKYIFEKADKDHSGNIEPDQVEGLLSSLGFNESVKEIENFFRQIDQNFDNRISFSEFRQFIESYILPQMSNFDEEEEELEELLRNNDIFRHGALSAVTLQAVLERYGVKISGHELQFLVRSLNPEGSEVQISKLLMAVRDPTLFSGKVKAVLYKIRLRKKVQIKEIQKIFENISSCFVLAYTPTAIVNGILTPSSPYKPQMHESALFFSDLPLKDARKGSISDQGLIVSELTNSDLLVELLLKEVCGVPIPQKGEIKGNIRRRYMNVCLYDLSSETMKGAVWQVEGEWDPQVEDVWRFSSNSRSLFVKIAGYEPRKLEKYVLLFELVIAVVESNRTLEINCGCSTLPLRELSIPDGKTAKKLKLIAGLPTRAKEIDKTAISKRTGWKTFFGGEVTSELELELIHANKFREQHRMLAALPAQCILSRKALHYLWTYREFLAESAFQGGNLNPYLPADVRVVTFALSLDVPDLFLRVWPWWKERVEPKVKSFGEAKKIFKVLMQELYLVLNARQFELLRKCPSKPVAHNSSLSALRTKMIGEVLDNVEQWLSSSGSANYKRKKNYNYNFGPLQLQETEMPREHRLFMEQLAKLSLK